MDTTLSIEQVETILTGYPDSPFFIRQQLKPEDYEQEMFGIYSTSVCEETIDEAPMVYKDSKEIEHLIYPTVQVVEHIRPIYNFKAKSLEETFTKK